MEQISFSDADYPAKKEVTRDEKLLLEMEQIILGQCYRMLSNFCTLSLAEAPSHVRACCASTSCRTWFTLSEHSMENALYEIQSMRRFASTIELSVNNDNHRRSGALYRYLARIRGIAWRRGDWTRQFGGWYALAECCWRARLLRTRCALPDKPCTHGRPFSMREVSTHYVRCSREGVQYG
jgi:hypothetical protein